MRAHNINSVKNGISGWYIDPHLADKILQFYKSSETKEGQSGGGYIDKSVKDSLDIRLGDPHLFNLYEDSLIEILNLYEKEYPHSTESIPFVATGFNIQGYYPPTGGYHRFHYEKSYPHNVYRHLVYMTYLNDVEDGGETEFLYQNVKIKPEKGLTLVWSADWFFTHKGHTSSSEKYIITGWFEYNIKSLQG